MENNKKLYQVFYIFIWLFVTTTIQGVALYFLTPLIGKVFAFVVVVFSGVLLLGLIDTYIKPYFYDED